MIAAADEIQHIKEIKTYRTACQASLMNHTRYFFYKQYSRRFIIGQHHIKIVDALERVLKGELKRLIINIAPRYGKTELAVKNFISHGLALNPAAKFIHLSYSDSLALDNSEAIKDLINSDSYQELFPEVKIKIDSKAKEKWYTTAGGGVLARAAAGSVTGFGAGAVDNPDEQIAEFLDEFDTKLTFAGAIIIDDPIKPEDADSDTLRVKVNERFDSTIRNRVNSRDTPIIVIMQRLHPEDLSGYLMRDDEQDEWEVLSMPCLYFDEYGNKQALWEFKETVEELEKQERANEVVFMRQKQQDPAPKTGLMFPKQDLHYFDINEVEVDDADYQYLPVDPADEGGNFFASLRTCLIDGKIYVPEVLFNTDGTDLNELAVHQMIMQSKINFVGVESVLGWKETAKRIRDELYDANWQGDFIFIHPRTKKHARITNRSSFIKNNMYFRRDYKDLPQYKAFMDNLTTYLKVQEPGKGNKHDDAPDVCEMVADHYEKKFPELW